MELVKQGEGILKGKIDVIKDSRMLSTKENYSAIVIPYTEDFGNDHRNLDEFIDPMVSILVEKKIDGPIIDLGSGPGNVIDYLLEKEVDNQIIGVDFVDGFCKNLSKKYLGNSQIGVVNSDFVSYVTNQSENSVAAYTAGYSIIHIPDDRICGLFKNISKTLKKDGLFFFSVYEGEDKGMQPEPYQEENDFRLIKTNERLEAYINNFKEKELIEKLNSSDLKIVKLLKVDDAQPGEYPHPKILILAQK
jgi:SAM-dependent methyltransferase